MTWNLTVRYGGAARAIAACLTIVALASVVSSCRSHGRSTATPTDVASAPLPRLTSTAVSLGSWPHGPIIEGELRAVIYRVSAQCPQAPLNAETVTDALIEGGDIRIFFNVDGVASDAQTLQRAGCPIVGIFRAVFEHPLAGAVSITAWSRESREAVATVDLLRNRGARVAWDELAARQQVDPYAYLCTLKSFTVNEALAGAPGCFSEATPQ